MFHLPGAVGHSTGDSLVEPDHVNRCRELLAQRPDRVALGSGRWAAAPPLTDWRPAAADIATGWKGLDIGPATSAAFAKIIGEAGTVLWNGPMGAFEDPRFSAGTRAIAEAVAGSPAFSVVGGGDTVAAVRRFHLSDRINHLSTGGGATLEFIESGDLPGLRALRESVTGGDWPQVPSVAAGH